jgi:hypothetical protein
MIGNCITFPQDPQQVAKLLPIMSNLTTLKVIFIGNEKPTYEHFKKILTVRKKKVELALSWLIKNKSSRFC